MRKAQIAGQIFIYIIAVVVVGFIIVYGYSAIKGFSDKESQVEFITLKTNVENSFKSIISDYGSIKRPDLDVPGRFRMLCFVDKTKAAASATTDLCREGGADGLYEPVVCATWSLGRDNVFLVPDGSVSWDVGDIILNDGDAFLCLPVVNNKVKLQLKSLGDKVRVSTYD